MSKTLQGLLILFTSLWLAACGGDDDGSSGSPPPTGSSDPFAAVDEAARAAYASQPIAGMGLSIYDRNGTKVFEHMYGSFSADQRVAIASASKLVSGVVLFRLIDQGYLSLDSTTGQVLGWTGDKANITLRQLLSFTSGLPPENRCTYRSDTSLSQCVDEISQMDLVAPPGTRFDYGSTHLDVAGRMAEVATGSSWNAIFAAQLRDALGMPSDLLYYANPLRPLPTDNPLLAGGLITSMNEYEHVLHFVFDKGLWQGSPLLASGIFDTQAIAPYPNAVIGHSPAPNGMRYGLTAWLECDTPATGCATISSPGAFGFTPWLDRDTGYYAILGMEFSDNSSTHFGGMTEAQLKPLIKAAFAAGLATQAP
ncbi:MAG TPA: serine hydrolase domain-containing protein [Steroidobacteraceae bacterium]|jgi:CubicO group peptidase (beta-lactamase class C family)